MKDTLPPASASILLVLLLTFKINFITIKIQFLHCGFITILLANQSKKRPIHKIYIVL